MLDWTPCIPTSTAWHATSWPTSWTPSLLDHFWQLGRNDPDRRVRQTALAVLQRLGQATYAEAMKYLDKWDGMAE